MTNGSSKIKVDIDLYLKIHDCQFDTLLDALVIINEKSKTIVDKMKKWKKLKVGADIQNEDIEYLENWVRDTPTSSPGGESYKIARSLMWYIVKKHLGGNIGERFKEIKIEITFPP
jgi:hypothetical protein